MFLLRFPNHEEGPNHVTTQVAEEGDELKLYCLTSGQDIKWSRTVNGIKEELKAPTYQVSKSYR